MAVFDRVSKQKAAGAPDQAASGQLAECPDTSAERPEMDSFTAAESSSDGRSSLREPAASPLQIRAASVAEKPLTCLDETA